MKKYWLALTAVSIFLTIGVSTTVQADNPFQGCVGRSEVRFLEGMIDHHQMAVDMANDCLKKAETEAVVTLCNGIITSQTAEIKTMHDWLLAWYQIDYNPMSMSHMMEMMQKGDHQGMMGGIHMGHMTLIWNADAR
jgi:hypothetical protein